MRPIQIIRMREGRDIEMTTLIYMIFRMFSKRVFGFIIIYAHLEEGYYRPFREFRTFRRIGLVTNLFLIH